MILFKHNIGSYAARLGLEPAQISAQAADADYYEFMLRSQKLAQQYAREWTVRTDLGRYGGAPPVIEVPAALVLPPAVPPVAPGIEARFRALVQQIKAHPNYQIATGKALGIEAAELTPPDLAAIRPRLSVRITGNRAVVRWNWQGWAAFLDQCEIEVDRADGRGYVTLTIDNTPGFVDLTPFPPAPAKWSYRAIYRVKDARVGQWSLPVSISTPA